METLSNCSFVYNFIFMETNKIFLFYNNSNNNLVQTEKQKKFYLLW